MYTFILLKVNCYHHRCHLFSYGYTQQTSYNYWWWQQAGVHTGVSSWLGQTGVKRSFVALVAWDLTTRCAATLPITNSLRLLSSWDYRQFWVSTAVYLRSHYSGMLHCIRGYWFPTFRMTAVPSKHQEPLSPWCSVKSQKTQILNNVSFQQWPKTHWMLCCSSLALCSCTV